MVGVHESSSLNPDVRRAINDARKREKISTPPGSMQLWPGATNPNGWLLCQGQAISRTFYKDIFALVGTTYGVGDGSTTFNLPDLRGRTVIGVGTGTGLTARALAAKVGTEAHTLTAAQTGLPDHVHYHRSPIGRDGNFHIIQPNNADLDGNGSTYDIETVVVTTVGIIAGPGSVMATEIYKVTSSTPGAVAATGSSASASHPIMQPSLALNFIIKI